MCLTMASLTQQIVIIAAVYLVIVLRTSQYPRHSYKPSILYPGFEFNLDMLDNETVRRLMRSVYFQNL